MSESFIGMNDFIWFVGVVENNSDPKKAGRVQVRAVGHHTQDKTKISTADLPWASPMLSCNDAGISGLGNTPGFLPLGTHVMGYFRDGTDRQEPVILGVLPGIPQEGATADKNLGFYDPTGVHPRFTQEPDVNRLARNDADENNKNLEHTSLAIRKFVQEFGNTNIATAGHTSVANADATSQPSIATDVWSQPTITYNTTYPFNHVYESESGHIREYDDTPGAERIHERHRSGTSYEIDADGNKTDLVTSHYYNIVNGDSKNLVRMSKDETIDGHYKLLINAEQKANQSFTIQVGSGSDINLQMNQGNLNVICNGNMNTMVIGNKNETIVGNYKRIVGGTTEITSTVKHDLLSIGPININGKPINLN